MRLLGLRLEFRVELYGDEPRMVGDLDDLGQLEIGIHSRDDKTGRLEFALIVRIEFVAMPVPFANDVWP